MKILSINNMLYLTYQKNEKKEDNVLCLKLEHMLIVSSYCPECVVYKFTNASDPQTCGLLLNVTQL